MPTPKPMLVCIGCYTPELGGHGTGVTTFRHQPDGRLDPIGGLDLPCPSWLEWHPSEPVLYSAHELEDGSVSAIRVAADGSLTLLNTMSSEGSLPCHLAVTADGRYLLAANYGSGSTAVYSLASDGRITTRTDLITHESFGLLPGPATGRQDGPHAHMVVVHADVVTLVDLGLDALVSMRLDRAGRLTRTSISRLRPGTGPRQLVRLPQRGRALVLGELAGTLTLLEEPEPGVFTETASVPATTFDGPNQSAHLHVSPNGAWALASNRGPDTVALFDLTGHLPMLVEEYSIGTGWPRHFAVVGGSVYVGNQHADEVVTFRLDESSGRLTRQGSFATGSPVCVVSRPLSQLANTSQR